jgi:hypothetical protein
MADENDILVARTNAEGYPDPTVYRAFTNIDKEADEKFRKLLSTIFAICELSGFHIEERIVVKDKRTGRVWR